jgi:hypothetical protein
MTICGGKLVGWVGLAIAKLSQSVVIVPRGMFARTCLTSIGTWISGTFLEIHRSRDWISIGCLTAPAILRKLIDNAHDHERHEHLV